MITIYYVLRTDDHLIQLAKVGFVYNLIYYIRSLKISRFQLSPFHHISERNLVTVEVIFIVSNKRFSRARVLAMDGK